MKNLVFDLVHYFGLLYTIKYKTGLEKRKRIEYNKLAIVKEVIVNHQFYHKHYFRGGFFHATV